VYQTQNSHNRGWRIFSDFRGETDFHLDTRKFTRATAAKITPQKTMKQREAERIFRPVRSFVVVVSHHQQRPPPLSILPLCVPRRVKCERVRATHSPICARSEKERRRGWIDGWVGGCSFSASHPKQSRLFSLPATCSAHVLFTLANNTWNLRSICVA
jgi:hypothetical protein